MRFTKLIAALAAVGVCIAATAALSRPQERTNTTAKSQPRAKSLPKSGVLRVVAILENAGIKATEVTGQIDGQYLQATKRVMRARGAADVAIFEIGGSMHALVVRFDDQAALERVVNSRQPLIRVEDCLVLGATQATDVWPTMSKALAEHGAMVSDSIDWVAFENAAKAASTMSTLETIRAQCELYALTHNNDLPDFAKSGWKAMLDEEFLSSPPVNKLCAKAEVATKIVVIDKTGADGRDVPLDSAGWVWNSADRTMHAAGTSEEQLDQIMSEGDIDSSDWLSPPEHVITGMLGEARSALANFYMSFEEGQERFPTMQELVDGRTELKPIPQNPFNGSAAVQAASWRRDNPPVSGAAGWNYDERERKFWANTNVVGENEF